MFAKADIVTVRKDSVISIPKDIIKNRRGGKLVYTVDRNSAAWLRNRSKVKVMK